MRRFSPTTASVCLLYCTPGLLSATEPSNWVGEEVMVRSAQAVLRKEPDGKSDAVDGSFGGRIYKVRAAEGAWIQTRQGWITINGAVRRDQAIAFFSAEIEKMPSAFAYASRSCAYSRY